MQLVRRPLFWMITAEAVVVMVLLGAAWHFFDGYRHRASVASTVVAKGPARSGSGPVSAPKISTPPPAGSPKPAHPAAPTPGVRLPFDITALNSDAASWERQEERLATALTRALRAYLETVVVPAVERAERVTPATSPATTQSPAAMRNMP